MRNFKIYRSSAGSGKTFTLTKEYLKLALKSPDYFRSILAVTFTNKATQEMKGRIIEQLYALSSGEGVTILPELSQATGLDPMALQARAKQVLTHILHNYSQFSVSTIDSFFQKVIRAFTREIGLQSGFTLELDQQKVLDEVIDQVLMDVGKDEQLTQWLIQFAEEKVEAGSNWDFRKDIRMLAQEIFQEHYKSFEKDIAATAKQKDFIPQLLKKLKDIIQTFEDEMKACGAKAMEIMAAHGLEVDDFSNRKSGVMGYLAKIAQKDDYKPGSRARGALIGPENWHTKTSKKATLIAEAVMTGLGECLENAISKYDTNYQQYESARQIMRFIYTFGILANITQKLEDYRDENDLMLISDAATFLKEIIGNNDAPFIYEKIGATYKHYLIDEFQDTSGFQWENFQPLVKNSLAEGHTNLVVGDVKQSIYRWRGGDWRLLLEKIVEDVGAAQTEELNLNQNWRSGKNIIDFNNSLFAGTPSLLEALNLDDLKEIESESLQEFLKTEAKKIATAYKDVFQEFPSQRSSKVNPGYVNISFVQSPEEEEDVTEAQASSWKEEVLKRIPKMVEDFQDNGYALKDIAFLVRNKSDGKLIADRLLAYKSLPEAKVGYRYEVISSESLKIGSAVSVGMIINALRYFDNPQDVIAKATMLYDYQVYVRNRPNIDQHALFIEAVNETIPYNWLPEDFKFVETSLTSLPLYEVVEVLVRVFELQDLNGEYAYMQAFQDAVLEYSKKENADIASFLKWWDDQGQDTTVQISDTTDAMKILTIHKSKGLQYKVVVVPFCDWKIDHDAIQNNTLWCCSDLSPFNEIPYLPLKYSGSLKSTIYQESYYEERVKAYMDALNLLYVAFTRAEENLWMMGEQPRKNKNGEMSIRRVSDLIYAYFDSPIEHQEGTVNLQSYWDSENNVFSFGQALQVQPSGEKQSPDIIALEHYPSFSWRNRIAIKPRQRNFLLEEEMPVAQKINYGLLMHEILAEVALKSDLPKVIRQYLFSGVLSKQEAEVLEEKLEKVLDHPEASGWFEEGWEVRTEVPILPLSGKLNRLDRVMIKGKHAVVVDFKSGAVQEKYKLQVKRYAQLLREMGYEPVDGYVFYLEPATIVNVPV